MKKAKSSRRYIVTDGNGEHIGGDYYLEKEAAQETAKQWRAMAKQGILTGPIRVRTVRIVEPVQSLRDKLGDIPF